MVAALLVTQRNILTRTALVSESLTAVTCTGVLLMTLDLVGCPQAPDSPICPLDVADSLSTQQVLSGLTFAH